jgi:hypothetical protein
MSSTITTPHFEIVQHGIDSPSYFQGQGTCHTPYTEVQTGTGDTPNEAFLSALESLCCAEFGLGIKDLADAIEAQAALIGLSTDETPVPDNEELEKGEVDEEPLQYYVSILYSI